MLPREEKIAGGWDVCQKHYAHGNPIGRSNQKPILDIYLYELEFAGGDITELAANAIAELMYAQSDVNGN